MILKKKKFWSAIKLKKKESKFGILLDKNLLKTPQEKDCLISNIRIAKDLLKEWSSIQDDINFHNLPVTQICFSSLDRKRKEKIILLNKLTEYGMTDLLFYRDISGTELEKLQSKKWDKLLDWTQNEFNIDFKVVNGIMPVEQPKENYNTFFNELEKLDCISLTALSDIVTLSGSLILGLLLLKKKIISKQAWSLAKVDEEWQRSKWGTLPEQVEDDEYKKNKFFISCKLINLLN